MIPLFFILGALGLAAGAATAQAPPARRRRTTRRVVRPRSTVRRVTPRPAARKATARAIIKRMTPRERRLMKKLKGARIRPTKKGQEVLRRLFALAASKKGTTHPLIAKAARRKIKQIAVLPKKERGKYAMKLPSFAKLNIAKTIVKADKVTPTAAQAARTLQLYTKEGGWQGTKNRRSTVARNSQKYMGLTADGIIGPKTRRRAKALGYPLYSRSHQKPGAWRAAA